MRKVRYAVTHQPFFCPEAGQLGNNLGAGVHSGMELWWTSEGLEVKWTSKATKKPIQFIIPAANVVGCQFEIKPEAVTKTA